MKTKKTESVPSLKSIKSIRSLKSIKSNKGIKTVGSSSGDYGDEERLTFEEALPKACKKFACPFSVIVRKQFQQDDFYRQLKTPEAPVKYKKIAVAIPKVVSTVSQIKIKKSEDKITTSSVSSIDEDAITATAVYDNVHNLTEIQLSQIGRVPRSLIQIIGYLALSYEYLTKITISRCIIDFYTIHELFKMLYLTTITDICLDGSPVPEGNYYVFLDRDDTNIKYLSLCRCRINDKICEEIATRLHYFCPAEKTLLLLNLSSNHITDEGAKHLGEALRTNRHLRYLNLADNRISDDGAGCIFNALIDFRLTYDETMSRRRRLLEYLKAKRLIVCQYLYECEKKSLDESSQLIRKSGTRKRNTSATSLKNKGTSKKDGKGEKVGKDYPNKAELFANEILGPLADPFPPNGIKIKDDYCYSLGNLVLCYLNLSYNNFGYLSIKKLLTVLQYQRVVKNPLQSGLVKVVIEGNDIPAACIEYQNINDLMRLAKSMHHFGGRLSEPSGLRSKRSTRISLVSPNPPNFKKK